MNKMSSAQNSRIMGSNLSSNNQSEGPQQINRKGRQNGQVQRCAQHQDTEFSLYDVDSRVRKCPKCVIYSKDKNQYLGCRFIEVESDKKIQDVLNVEIGKAKQIYSITASHLKRAQSCKSEIKQRILEKLKKQYDDIIRQLARYLQEERKSAIKQVQQAWNNTMLASIPRFQKVEVLISSLCDNSKNNLDKISETYLLRDECLLLNKKLEEDTITLRRNLQKIQSNISWNARVQYSTIQQEYKKVEALSKSKKNIIYDTEDQLLIDLSSPKNNLVMVEINCQSEKINEGYRTERTSLTNETLQSDQISLKSSQTISTSAASKFGANKQKSHLFVKNMSEISKIDTQVREISVRDLGLSNTDAKKVLQSVSKSFVKSLDLSGNKISSAFIKDLSKNNIGKYLKVIRLQKNSIDLKDAAVFKKVQLLKGQGVNIII